MFKNKKKQNYGYNLRLFSVAFFLALLAHSQVIYRMMKDGILFTGKGDGIAQMIPFQMYLYQKFTHFNFFYAMDFGIGGDFFRSLAYYYSTSPVAYINYIFIWFANLFLDFNIQDPVFWAKNQIFISIIKLTIIIVITYRLLRYIHVNRFASITGAFLYAWSTTYFFFTFTWSFFSDVMIWLPLSILGMERFFHEKKIGMFIIAIALTLHANFYFSYYEFIFLMCYFLYRVVYPKPTDVVNRLQKITVLAGAALLGLGVAAVGIFTGVTSYLMNDRTLPPINIKPFIDMVGFYNLFYDGYYIVICFITVLAVMTFKLYQDYMYRLFASLTLLFMVCSLSPLFDSFFNGFSIDQRRWVYLLSFTSAILVACYLNHLKHVDLKSFFISLVPIVIIYPVSVYGHEKLLSWLYFIPLICLMIGLFIYLKNHLVHYALYIVIVLMNLVFVHQYVTEQLDTLHPFNERDIDYLNSAQYNSKTQRQMIDVIKKSQPDNDRIEWQTSSTHNTPMYQNFQGIKLYSSIFDKDILKFYDKELSITMPTDSNSIYYGLGERANLYSLFNVSTTVRTSTSPTLPFGFKASDRFVEPNESKQYQTYKNEYRMPFVRVTNRVFDARQLKTPLDREHAMLSGVVLNQQGHQSIEPARNLLNKAQIHLQDAKLTGQSLTVTKENGGPRIQLPKSIVQKYKDFYVTMSIESKTFKDYHYVWLNEIYQSRKPLDDDYRRFNPTITLKVNAQRLLELKLKPGEYHFQLNGIYGENYETLKKAAQQQDRHQFKFDHGKMHIQLAPHKAGYVVIPVPYLEGMKATIDGHSAQIKEGNYLMTAIPVNEKASDIEITYTPPYFHLMQCISILSMILSVIFTRWIANQNYMHQDKSFISYEEEAILLKKHFDDDVRKQ
ncbi:YfhO family protein [Macrococcoides caseolyticum]|uniref:YfhO family protein n=1 Tax=Macrococcoides caseolyticum TaxID=69966 RepID=UPI001F25C2FF|nr:YfhO family protein [Macrococcus caseolyticus]MCE4956767.1 YfhO family protein [Macrococcus caseolyticus]